MPPWKAALSRSRDIIHAIPPLEGLRVKALVIGTIISSVNVELFSRGIYRTRFPCNDDASLVAGQIAAVDDGASPSTYFSDVASLHAGQWNMQSAAETAV